MFKLVPNKIFLERRHTMGDNNSKGEKEFAKYELVYISVLTIILLIGWVLSYDIFDSLLSIFTNKQYCYAAMGAAILVTAISMKIFGRKLVSLISRIWISKDKKNG